MGIFNILPVKLICTNFLGVFFGKTGCLASNRDVFDSRILHCVGYYLDRYHRRRDAAIARLGGKCAVCGTTRNLHIDHINPSEKAIEMGKMWAVAESRYLAELKRCQLLCAKHHRQKSALERSVDHGGGVTGKRNCYCELCGPLKRAYMAQYRSKRKALPSQHDGRAAVYEAGG
ncbi:hypothetical protein MINTM005_13940 [Mycobacterium intracellulare]|nr:hypothetical protein MINTM005_13940 [Mycobacterium intracellulare]